jgi:hypothetical protein
MNDQFETIIRWIFEDEQREKMLLIYIIFFVLLLWMIPKAEKKKV